MSIRGHQDFSKIDPLNGYATKKLEGETLRINIFYEKGD